MSIIHTYKVPQSLNNNIETYQYIYIYTDHQTIYKNLIFHRIKSHNSGATKIKIVKMYSYSQTRWRLVWLCLQHTGFHSIESHISGTINVKIVRKSMQTLEIKENRPGQSGG